MFRYLAQPALLSGHKFDLRLFALVTSVSPLRAYLHTEGIVRLAALPYSASSDERRAFLTNSRVNEGGHMAAQNVTWTLQELQLRMRARGRDPAELWRRVEAAVSLVLLAADVALARARRGGEAASEVPERFQLLGVDVILDGAWQPHVMELNGQPSMGFDATGNKQVDRVKLAVLKDSARLLLGA